MRFLKGKREKEVANYNTDFREVIIENNKLLSEINNHSVIQVDIVQLITAIQGLVLIKISGKVVGNVQMNTVYLNLKVPRNIRSYRFLQVL